jgi:RNA polymerase sigma factor, sigma-70 family
MDAAASDNLHEPALWQRLRAGDDRAAREQLLALHLPYARVVAATYYARRFHDEVEFADYLQYASLGMLEAMERYDPARGVQFRTFAARRMHGAILNGLERLTEKQQQIAARQRLRAERLQELKDMAARETGCGAALPQEEQQVLKFVSEVGIGLALCWMLEGTAMVDSPDAAVSIPFYRSAAVKELRERLLRAVDGLPPQERTVVRNHYLQDMPFDAIATLLKLSKGRISQIHKQALQRLRGLVGEQADWNFSA